jgi:hypothetical protein
MLAPCVWSIAVRNHRSTTSSSAYGLPSCNRSSLSWDYKSVTTDDVNDKTLTRFLQQATGRARPRLWWCVTGDFGFLPIHAAGIYQDHKPFCTADYVVSSYVPTLSSLTKARNGWKPVPRTELSGLLLCEASCGDNGPARYLPNAANEVRLVRERFELANAEVLNTVSAHLAIRAALTAGRDASSHRTLCLSRHSGPESAQERVDAAGRSSHHQRDHAIEPSTRRTGVSECMSDGERRQERTRSGGASCGIDVVLWLQECHRHHVVGKPLDLFLLIADESHSQAHA